MSGPLLGGWYEADNHTDDIDRALAVKDARIAELEAEIRRLKECNGDAVRLAAHAQHERNRAEREAADLRAANSETRETWDAWKRDAGYWHNQSDSLRAALEAEKAARVKAVEAEREACAATLEAWADSEDREALLKQPDAPCSAGSHAESAIIARRHAGLIRARGGR